MTTFFFHITVDDYVSSVIERWPDLSIFSSSTFEYESRLCGGCAKICVRGFLKESHSLLTRIKPNLVMHCMDNARQNAPETPPTISHIKAGPLHSRPCWRLMFMAGQGRTMLEADVCRDSQGCEACSRRASGHIRSETCWGKHNPKASWHDEHILHYCEWCKELGSLNL